MVMARTTGRQIRLRWRSGALGSSTAISAPAPLYAFREALSAAVGHGPVTPVAVLGVLSMIVWALVITVTIKYVLILLRADNNGEGGTLSLTALASRAVGRRTALIFFLGMVGAAMFYGDSVITPAISVLSAVEGLKLATPAFDHVIVPVTVVILVILFVVQSRGTARVAMFFGPIMTLWFLVIAAAASSIYSTSRMCSLRSTRSMLSGLWWNTRDRSCDAWCCVPVGDGRRGPLRRSWTFWTQAHPDGLALPRATVALINYFAQGALVLANPHTMENPFYLLFPRHSCLS